MPFGKKQVYAQEIIKASLERLAHLIKVCGFLLQTEVLPILENKKERLGCDVNVKFIEDRREE